MASPFSYRLNIWKRPTRRQSVRYWPLQRLHHHNRNCHRSLPAAVLRAYGRRIYHIAARSHGNGRLPPDVSPRPARRHGGRLFPSAHYKCRHTWCDCNQLLITCSHLYDKCEWFSNTFASNPNKKIPRKTGCLQGISKQFIYYRALT